MNLGWNIRLLRCLSSVKIYRDKPALTDAGGIDNFHAADNSAWFKFKQKIAGVTKNVEIMVPLKYLSNL